MQNKIRILIDEPDFNFEIIILGSLPSSNSLAGKCHP